MIFANCNFGNTAKSIVRRRLHRQHCALARVVVVVKSRRQKSSSSFLAPRSRKRWWWSQRKKKKKKKKKKCFLCLFCASFSPEEKRPPFSFFILRTTLTRCVLLLRSAQPRETATTTRSGRRKDHRIVSRGRLNTNVLVRGGRRCISCGVEGTPTPTVGWTTPPTPTTVRIRGATSLRDVCVFFEKKTPPPPPSPTTTTTTTTRVRGSRVGLRRRRSRRGFRDERDAVVDSAVPNSSLSTGSLSR